MSGSVPSARDSVSPDAVRNGATIVVSGLIAQHPRIGGMTWHYLQYVVGLARLGHDVYYLEDSGEWPYLVDADGGEEVRVPQDCRPGVAHLALVMSAFGLADRWAFRCAINGGWSGLPTHKRKQLLASADLLINVSGSLADLTDYRRIPCLAYVDTDPVFAQINLLRGPSRFRSLVDAHDLHFTFGERLSGALADTGHRWLPTRQPVLLDEWRGASASGSAFTTVMNAASYGSEHHAGRRYGQKDVELRRLLDLPARVRDAELELAVAPTAGEKPDGERRDVRPEQLLAELRAHGWRVVDASRVCGDHQRYRDYIRASRGEWSVAKNGYVEGAAGWFSERSACYLATGRPVITQDTGFSHVLPTGEGLFAFSTTDEAVAAIESVQAGYARHSEAARQVAEASFDSRRVLTRLVEHAFSTRP
jgi:hypothetical protein